RSRDRFDDQPRRERNSSPAAADAGMTRLFLNVGRKLNIRPGDIVGAIAGETDLRGNQIGAIDIFDGFTFVDVPQDSAPHVIDVMSRSQIRGFDLDVNVAR
ncbi:MAG: DbpA RNA binding domain-containing protein, partial [Catalinimonas sp.]